MRGLVEATELYLKGWKPKGRRLVAISNSGAVCVMTADAATAVGMPMAKLADETDKKLKGILPSFATTTNPIDLTAALLSNSRLFGDILPVIAEDPAADAFLIGVPVAGPGYDVEAFARDAAAFGKQTGKPLVVAATQRSVADQFSAEGCTVFPDRNRSGHRAASVSRASRIDGADARTQGDARPARRAGGFLRGHHHAQRSRQPRAAGRARHSGGAASAVPLARRSDRRIRGDRRTGRGQRLLGRHRAQVGAWAGQARRQHARGGRRNLRADGRHHPQARRALRRRHHRGDGGRPARDHDRRASRSGVRAGGGGRRRRQVCRDLSRHHAAAAAVFEGRREGGARPACGSRRCSRACAASRRWMSTRCATRW